MDGDFEESWSIEYRELYFLLMGGVNCDILTKEGQVLFRMNEIGLKHLFIDSTIATSSTTGFFFIL